MAKIEQEVAPGATEFVFLKHKIQAASLQIYDIDKWDQTACGVNYYNPELNPIIGPESHIPWSFMLEFKLKERQFKKGELDTKARGSFRSLINYLPVIEQHPSTIHYLLGTHEVGDWNLWLNKRYLEPLKNVRLHIFEKAGPNIWIDHPETFQQCLSTLLERMNP